MVWDRGRHFFEIEALPDGTYDWFYMERDSEGRAGRTENSLGACPPEMFSYLRKTLGVLQEVPEEEIYYPECSEELLHLAEKAVAAEAKARQRAEERVRALEEELDRLRRQMPG